MRNVKLAATIGVKLGEEYGLTPSEIAVVEALIAGQRPAEIAAARGGSVGTVRVHIRRIFSKINIHGVNELFSLALAKVGDGKEGDSEALAT